MAASGIQVAEECTREFGILKLPPASQRNAPRTKFIIFRVNLQKTDIVVDKVEKTSGGTEEDEYQKLVESLPETECRWAVYDFEYQLPDGGHRKKLLFVSWSPELSSIKDKMLYSASKSALRIALSAQFSDVQATDFDDISWDTTFSKFAK